MHAIHLMIFVHKSLTSFIKHVGSTYIKTGLYNYGGNKGAVSIWFMFKHISIIFINCHLAGKIE
jgi:hypothetical protein